MASEIDICNLALIRVGAPEIESLNDDNRQAGVLKIIYPMIRDSVLEEHDWGFARREESLAEVTNTWEDYAYAYAYPADCFALRYIYSGIKTMDAISLNLLGNVPFDIRQTVNGNSRVILTNVSPAVAIYTASTDNAGVFPPKFVDALSARLASELARVLIIDDRKATNWYQIYNDILAKAKSLSANEAVETPSNTNNFVNARL